MMQLYGADLVRERSSSDNGGEIARYLKWEYGEGTGLGVLNGWVAQSGPPSRKGRLGFVDRFARLPAAIKARVAARQIDGWGASWSSWRNGNAGTQPVGTGQSARRIATEDGIPGRVCARDPQEGRGN